MSVKVCRNNSRQWFSFNKKRNPDSFFFVQDNWLVLAKKFEPFFTQLPTFIYKNDIYYSQLKSVIYNRPDQHF